jgi:hypothetical protein
LLTRIQNDSLISSPSANQQTKEEQVNGLSLTGNAEEDDGAEGSTFIGNAEEDGGVEKEVQAKKAKLLDTLSSTNGVEVVSVDEQPTPHCDPVPSGEEDNTLRVFAHGINEEMSVKEATLECVLMVPLWMKHKIRATLLTHMLRVTL